MFLTFEDRPSNSPFIERVWRCYSVAGGKFYSMAECNIELVVTRLPGLTRVTLRGPVTKAAMVDCPPNGQWLTIRFRLGTYLPKLPTALLLDHSDLDLPLISDNRFWFEGSGWEIPSYENAEAFVDRLARCGAIAYDATVGRAVMGDPEVLALRSVQRHFLRATGMAHGRIRKIERARHAVEMLRQGSAILDVVHTAGYSDQAHLTRSLKQLIGQTPTKVARGEAQLSFSFKTTPLLYG
jgi:Helix-turn-helix domain